MHAFEVIRQRRHRVRKPPVRERVGRQDIAELVGNDGRTDGQQRQQRRAPRQGGQPRAHNGQPAPAREVGKAISVAPNQCSAKPGVENASFARISNANSSMRYMSTGLW